MAKEKKETTNSGIAVAIGFVAAFALQGVMVVAHRMALPFWLPAVVFLGLTFYFVREKVRYALYGLGTGMAIYLIGLFWWLTATGLID